MASADNKAGVLIFGGLSPAVCIVLEQSGIVTVKLPRVMESI
jgi:hypothetical protein